ncbi:MAG TPA: acireductone synthase [Nevskiales bacterium]|nr:acireductone synthase [Nevskiales bacterium]
MTVRAILTDIEGTTTDIAFVHKVLFPYARARIGDYVRTHASEPLVREQLATVSREVGRELTLEGAIGQLIRWIDEDRKITPLKALQGMIWAQGYRNGDFTGHVYPDVPAALRRWHAAGMKLYVYSSGSVQAQKLIFGHTPYGDLTPLFSGYFDTQIGGKREAGSYRRIAQDIGLPAGEILFLSDVGEELDAARAAGMQTTWLLRDGNPDPGARHPQVSDFDAIRV